MLRKSLPFVLSLLLVLTGQSVAASRGVDAAVGQMVLCTGKGPVIVYMDENGQPTKPPHFCPEFALTLLGAIAVAQPGLPEAPDRVLPSPAHRVESLIAAPRPSHPARAPPFSV